MTRSGPTVLTVLCIAAFALLFRETMMVAEQMEPRLHRRENLIDLRLAGVGSPAAFERAQRLLRLMREQDVDHVAQRLEGLDFLVNEMASFVCELGRLRAALLRMRKIGGTCLVPGRCERSAEGGDLNDWRTLVMDLDERPVVDMEEIRRQVAGRDGVEVVVVAVNPVDARAERFIRAGLGRDVADAQPERNVGMRSDDGACGVECAVDVAECPYLGDAGTSRSALSQMKSLLL